MSIGAIMPTSLPGMKNFGRGSEGDVLDPAKPAGSSWKQAFHGTWFYSLWSILE